MAGLLDFLSTPDAQLGLGLLSAGGYSATPMSVGQRINSAVQGVKANQADALKLKLLQSQIDENDSQNALRTSQISKAQQLQSMTQGLLGNFGAPQEQTSPGAYQPSTDGYGPTMPMPKQPASEGLRGVPLEKIAALKAAGGPDLIDAWKLANVPTQLAAGGYTQLPGQAPQYLADPSKGFDFKGGVVSTLPGAVESIAGLEGAKTGASERAKAGYDPMKVFNNQTQQEEFVPRLTVAAGGMPTNATTPGSFAQNNPGVRPMTPQTGESDAPAIWADALAKSQAALPLAKSDEERARINSDIAGIRSEMRRAGVPQPMGNAAPQSSNAFSAGPSATQKASTEALGDTNKSWIKTSYEPVIASIGPTDNLLTSIKVSRNALDQMGGTGWGTETKASAANVLAGLGIAGPQAKLLASNSQIFQSTAMDRLNSVLNQATGPQTEGDAERGQKTYASLKNTTEANKFILDLAEAKAQRDKLKAAFYQQALPVARAKGDLQEVDREWAARAPSVFSLPILSKWNIK